jgi:hypothetical protein
MKAGLAAIWGWKLETHGDLAQVQVLQLSITLLSSRAEQNLLRLTSTAILLMSIRNTRIARLRSSLREARFRQVVSVVYRYEYIRSPPALTLHPLPLPCTPCPMTLHRDTPLLRCGLTGI